MSLDFFLSQGDIKADEYGGTRQVESIMNTEGRDKSVGGGEAAGEEAVHLGTQAGPRVYVVNILALKIHGP